MQKRLDNMILLKTQNLKKWKLLVKISYNEKVAKYPSNPFQKTVISICMHAHTDPQTPLLLTCHNP